MQGDVVIREGTARDLPAVVALLEAAKLPTDGLSQLQEAGRLLVADDGYGLAAGAAIESHDRQALLRSVVVRADARGRGVGRRMVEAATVLAELEEHEDLWLLTEGAVEFFRDIGFERVDRAAVSGAVLASAEFSALCPSTAVAMRRVLGDGTSM